MLFKCDYIHHARRTSAQSASHLTCLAYKIERVSFAFFIVPSATALSSIHALATQESRWQRLTAGVATVVIHALIAWLVLDQTRFDASVPTQEEVRMRLNLLPAAVPPTPVAPVLEPKQVPQQSRTISSSPPRLEAPPVEHATRQSTPASLPSIPLMPPSDVVEHSMAASLEQDAALTQAAAPASPPAPPAPAAGMTDPNWEGRVLERLQRFRRYPTTAKAHRQEGVVFVRALVNHQGRVLAARVHLGSGYLALDDEALGTFSRAQPLPRPPHSLPDPVELEVPVEFFLQ
ncbi:protein TonB [Xanthomonas arboricola]|uniref:energy transducer TonB n=1 Tax=Xanthomonas euroxanthea TaxID=2259622 RepID=UPI003201A228|nr:protein TonB [Xanthomonas euroxanthea]